MNIQIYGTKKSADARKAERWFKERGIRYQYVDLAQKGMSPRELQNVAQAVGGADAMVDPNARDQDALALYRYTAAQVKMDVLCENQQLLIQPVVRNGKQATVGYRPDVWKGWGD